MFELFISGAEWWDERREMFFYTKDQTLRLEHSLVSVSKWESKWEKPFLEEVVHSREESIDYVRCMCLTQNVDPLVFKGLTDDHLRAVDQYVNARMSATTFAAMSSTKAPSQKITSELIYYWMILYHVPMEAQKWHLNRLLNLIRICEIKSEAPKKMSPKEIRERNERLNEERKKKWKTKG